MHARILVVDDQLTNRRLLQQLLSRVTSGAVDTAVDGQDALQRMCAAPYDFVFMDVDMPRMNGLEAIRAFRAWWADEEDRAGRARPFICVLSGYVAPDDRDESLAAGADEFMGKGSTPAKAVVEFARATCARRAAKAAEAAPPQALPAGDT